MKKIMVVEDSSLMASVIRNFVRKKWPDVEFIEAHNGKEAVDQYPLERPDIVFMDIKMPEMDGIAALELILQIDPKAKVVMVTSVKEQTQEKKALGIGARMYITKPFSSSEIFDALDV